MHHCSLSARGPYRGAYQRMYFDTQCSKVLVATGTGVNVAFDIVERARCFAALPQSVLVLFTTRSVTLFTSALEFFCRIGGLPPGITIKMFLTDPSVDKIVEEDGARLVNGITLSQGRADFDAEMHDIALTNAPHEVFFCGGNRILAAVQVACAKYRLKLYYDPPFTG